VVAHQSAEERRLNARAEGDRDRLEHGVPLETVEGIVRDPIEPTARERAHLAAREANEALHVLVAQLPELYILVTTIDVGHPSGSGLLSGSIGHRLLSRHKLQVAPEHRILCVLSPAPAHSGRHDQVEQVEPAEPHDRDLQRKWSARSSRCCRRLVAAAHHRGSIPQDVWRWCLIVIAITLYNEATNFFRHVPFAWNSHDVTDIFKALCQRILRVIAAFEGEPDRVEFVHKVRHRAHRACPQKWRASSAS
jgi:hypothetical protein